MVHTTVMRSFSSVEEVENDDEEERLGIFFTQLLRGLRAGSNGTTVDGFFRVARLDLEERADGDFLATSFVEHFGERVDFLDASRLDGSDDSVDTVDAVDAVDDAKLE